MAHIEHTIILRVDYGDLSDRDKDDIRQAAITSEGADTLVSEVRDIHGEGEVLGCFTPQEVVEHFGTDLLEYFSANALVEYAFNSDEEEACLAMTGLLEGDS